MEDRLNAEINVSRSEYANKDKHQQWMHTNLTEQENKKTETPKIYVETQIGWKPRWDEARKSTKELSEVEKDTIHSHSLQNILWIFERKRIQMNIIV